MHHKKTLAMGWSINDLIETEIVTQKGRIQLFEVPGYNNDRQTELLFLFIMSKSYYNKYNYNKFQYMVFTLRGW